MAALALDPQALEPPAHIPVDVTKVVGSVSGAEVLTPAVEHGVERSNHFAQVLVTSRPRGQRLHALLDPRHAALRGPSLQEVDALPLLLPQRARQPLVQMAAEEVEAAFAPAQLDS